MTRRKKGPKPRKPVVRRVGTKEERAIVPVWRSEPLMLSTKPIGVFEVSRPSFSVVAWVRENPLEATLIAGWLALTAAIVAVLP